MKLDEVIKAHVLKTLSESPSKAEAARRLGICIRSIRNYLHKWGREDLIDKSYLHYREKKREYRQITAKERDDYYNWEPR